MDRKWNLMSFAVVLGLSEVAILILFGIFVDYGWDGTPVSLRGQFLHDSHGNPNYRGPGTSAQELSQSRVSIPDSYSMFQDVHVMIFIGFGFLMTFMRRYGYGGVGFNFILASLVTQWSILMRGFFEMPENHYRIRLDMNKIIAAEFSAGTILISLGVVLGKLSPVQYVIMVVVETVLAMVNEYIVLYLYGAVDVGGTITIHLFGAYFGLALARTIHRREWSTDMFNDLKYGTHYNDLFSMCGTVFLFMFWPSFNAALAVGDSRYRAIFNTYLAISSSVIGGFVTCWIVKNGKFTMDIVQNGTLSGGVIVGSVCTLYLYPWGSILCGLMAGVISSLGFHYVTVSHNIN
ncbi:hypothetical protein RvY_18305-2 [Ramazzottius varieornatus]|uniref:Ammonium transporter AmtB-like domain-containing protein n=1 Tax=Ramazzottius varieornatus TaxID=947166 RepID=A0A1D1W6Y0_RAMVA|nr:hypothetical protein RvY_18305-2 [Ramazzottius varieornatus]